MLDDRRGDDDHGVFIGLIVALQLASLVSPVSCLPSCDNAGKVALATFVATFSFAFTVMRSTQVDAVPGISVTLAIFSPVFASIGVFIHYINHTAHSRSGPRRSSKRSRARRAQRIEAALPDERAPDFSAPELHPRATIVANEGKPGVVTGFERRSDRGPRGSRRRGRRAPPRRRRLRSGWRPPPRRPRRRSRPARHRGLRLARRGAHDAAGRRLWASPARRPCLEGALTRHQRPDHRGPGDRPDPRPAAPASDAADPRRPACRRRGQRPARLPGDELGGLRFPRD